MATFSVMDSMGFPFGINLAKPSESLDVGELVRADNCEYSREDGALRTMSGLVTVLSEEANTDIRALFWDIVGRCFYYAKRNSLFKVDESFVRTEAVIGLLSGDRKPVFANFGDVVLVASGGKLQKIDSTGLATIEGSPDRCDFVTVRAGRVLTYATNSDALNYSAIGDCESWTTDSADISSGQSVNIGYKEQGNIVALDFLSSCIMVYKEGGRAYKIVGEPQDSDFSCLPVSHTAYCQNIHSVTNIDTKSYFIGSAGFMSFMPTNVYGDVEPFDEGANINPVVMECVDDEAELWHLPCRKQIWIKTRDDRRVYVYHYLPRYQDGRGAFTIRNFVYPIHDVCMVGDDVYVAYGNKIGKIDDNTDKDDGKQIQTSIAGANHVASKHFILVMNRLIVLHTIVEGAGTLKVGKRAKAIAFGDNSPYAWDAEEYAYDANQEAYADEYSRSYRVGGGANKSVQVQLNIDTGSVSLRKFQYEFLEV